MRPRCGGCPNCLKVEQVREQAFAALAAGPGNGEAVALIWNSTLQDYPCQGVAHAVTRKAEANQDDRN